ncbi:hypothetical protein [Micromonospora endolithica]|nr:hypothetical protein [Micromonospora endolithica]
MPRRRGGGGTRWLAATVGVAAVLVGAAFPVDAAASPTPVAVTTRCEVRDGRLTEISGMVATDDGFVMINDGADDESRRRVFFLDRACAVVRTVSYPSTPRDTEDLAVGADGTLWVADIGDNNRSRETVAVWKLAPGADAPVLYRMAYPDGPHDAEAMLVTGDGRPLIVTKYSAVLYAPTAALRTGRTVPLARVGQVRLPASTTSNPFSALGRTAVTGAATAPDGRRVVLRTYADAFEFEVPDGDVVAALTGSTPSVTPLPDEPQGESITYSGDGRSLLTVSETAGQPPGTRAPVLRYPRPAAVASTPPPSTPPPTTAGSTTTPGPSAVATSDRTGVGRTPIVLAGACGLGAVVVGLLVARRRRRGSPARR